MLILRDLNPLTLLLLSVACALPVWAVNQLLWLHLERRMTSQIVGRIVLAFDISVKEKKVLSFALSRLLKAVDIMRFIPSKDIANLVTIVTIYLGAVVVYFTSKSPASLYITILSFSLIVWLACLFVLHSYCQKIDIKPLKKAWEHLINNVELHDQINRHFERIEKLIQMRTGQEKPDDVPEGTTDTSETPEQNS